MAKSVIILTVSLLVLMAVLIMLKYSGSADDPKESTQGAYSNLDDDAGEPYILPQSQGGETPKGTPEPEIPDNPEGPEPEENIEEKPDPPAPEQPEPVDLPEKIVLPCNDFVATRETTLSEIVDRYYSEYKSGGTRVVDDRSLRKELLAALATYNEMGDPNAPVGAGRSLKLPTIYIVVKGDTLDAIARKFYGMSAAVGDIYKANPKLHARGKGFIKIGWLLLLP